MNKFIQNLFQGSNGTILLNPIALALKVIGLVYNPNSVMDSMACG